MAELAPAALPPVRELKVTDAAALDALLASEETPFVVRGLVADWPLVKAARQGDRAVRAYLADKARPIDFTVSMAGPDIGGRLFYDDAMGVNFRMGKGRLPDIFAGFDKAENLPADQVPTVYLGSVDVHQFFDGVAQDNGLDLGARTPLLSLWIGNATRIAAHNDFPDNLACVVAGRRRFTLFPPDQFANLYLGPIDITPAGRPISMVDFAAPDFTLHPGFRDAIAHAQVAELEPGDALFIPSLWYHHVEGLARFNILMNYWWRDSPRYLGQPNTALHHAIMTIRDLPDHERAVWRAMFDHYVFSGGADARDHVPAQGQGVLAPLDAQSAARMHQFLLRSLSQ